MELDTLALILVGFIVGIIFVLDGWRPSPERDDIPFWKTPRIRGLLYILAGTTITSIYVVFVSDNPRKITIYVVSLIITIVLGLMLMLFYAILVTYNRFRAFNPRSPRRDILISAITDAMPVLIDGMSVFRQNLNAWVEHRIREEADSMIKKVISEKDKEITTLKREYEIALQEVRNNRKQTNKKNAEKKEQAEHLLVTFIDFYLELFESLALMKIDECDVDDYLTLAENLTYLYIVAFFEPPQRRSSIVDKIRNYRVSLYYYPPLSDKLVYLMGVSPRTARHTRRSLPLVGSVAGMAIQDPSKTHRPPTDVPPNIHQRRMVHTNYNSLVCYTLPQIEEKGNSTQPYLVLCIDTIGKDDSKNKKRQAYMDGRIKELALTLACSRAILGISGTAIHQYVLDQQIADSPLG